MECSHPGCGKTFSQSGSLNRHEKTHGEEKQFQCPQCPKRFHRKSNMTRHERICGAGIPVTVPQPTSSRKRNTPAAEPSKGFKIYRTAKAFRNATVTWKLLYKKNYPDKYIELLNESTRAMQSKLEAYRNEHHALKFNMSLHVEFEQAIDPSIVTVPPVVLITEQFEVYRDSDIPELLKICSEQLRNRIECYEGMGSGWTMSKLHALDTTIWKLEPLRGNTYHPLSAWIQNTKCVVNVQNMDNECFRHAVVAGLYKPSNPKRSERVSSYSYCEHEDNTPDFSMLTFPVRLRDILKFEVKNDISVNVYGVDERECKRKASLIEESRCEDDPELQAPECSDKKRGFIYPLRVAKKELTRHVNLLLTEKNEVSHYSTIKNFSGFLRCQYSKYNGATHYCYSCLHGFIAKKGEKERSECKLLQEHVKYCKTLDPQRVSYPKNETLEFKNIKNMLPHPIVGYADFESILRSVVDMDASTGIATPSTKKLKKDRVKDHKEIKYQKHLPASYFTKFVSIDSDFELPECKGFEFPQRETYVGMDAAEHFLDYVTQVADLTYKKYIEKPKAMIFTPEDEKKFEMADDCHICEKRYGRAILHCHKDEMESNCPMCKVNIRVSKKELVRAIHHCHNRDETKDNCSMCEVNSPLNRVVRDHCHILGHFRGAAHNTCNLKYSINANNWKLPIFFHNLRGYDGHLLIRALKKRHGKVRIIPTNMERYLSISVGRVQFLDSFQFTMKSLDALASTLDDKDFVETRKVFDVEEKFKLMRKKGVFPYDFFDDISKLESTRLPDQEVFYNRLEDKKCSDKEYAHAQNVWNTFKCRNFRDYHDLYLKGDVLILADFFEKFRQMCMENYGVDAAHYYSTPGMAWDSALKMTNVKLELFDNEEMYSFIERGIRGGISQISKRYVVPNNPSCVTSEYDPKKPTTYLIYLDANNLYGGAMSMSLPTGSFRWWNRKEIEGADNNVIMRIGDHDDIGCIFEVDAYFPDELHDKLSDYPLAPEKLTIDESMLSPFQKERFPSHQKKTTTKLSPNLFKKERYVVHYRNLKFHIEQGMVVTKIHRVLEFQQSCWLGEYIDFNTRMRTETKSDFGKDFFKLMNNSVSGKTQENLRNRMKVEVITDKKVALKRAAEPSMKRSQTIHDDLVIMERTVTNLKLCKPIYVGFSVLELSKLHMYRFHYEKIVKWFDKVNLCFTDTDSLLYEIETDDIYKTMLEHQDEFDFSEYPFKHTCYNRKNKKVIFKFKDELHSLILEEFIGLRPKCYSLLFHGEVKNNIVQHLRVSEKQVAKGTKKSVKKRFLTHEHFRQVITLLSTVYIKQNVLKTKAHDIGTYHQTKVSLTGFDTKRYILDGVNTLAHGHYRTR